MSRARAIASLAVALHGASRGPRPVDVADVLTRAADLLERDGWRQGGLQQGCRRCALGAIVEAAGVSVCALVVSLACEAVQLAAGIERPTIGGLGTWNDAPGRTAGEVIGTMRAAAAALTAEDSHG